MTKLKKNTISSLILQVTTLMCGFVLPKIMLNYFGSSVNGLVNSITQFLEIITFLELGVGAVIQSNLYKPLANKDVDEISKIVKSAYKFFRLLAKILLVYIFLLIIIYPNFINNEFSTLFTITLILAMSISSFAQYYFGIVERLLIQADQRGYIYYMIQTVTIILNTIATFILINLGAGIQLVKLSTSLIFLLKPLFIRLYTDKHYKINRNIKYNGEPIKQKWNGVAQHIAAVILVSTDSIVLTVFSTLENVSIYSVYYMVISGVRQLLISIFSGYQPLLGKLWAEDKNIDFYHLYKSMEWRIFFISTIVFGSTLSLIVPFIKIYTEGIVDANYIQPMFGALITIAYIAYCYKVPFNTAILATGKYKDTQNIYIITAILNIVVSIYFVKEYGLIGVAIGTLVAMCYQVVTMAYYCYKYIIKISLYQLLPNFISNFLIILIGYIFASFLHLKSITYLSWIIMSVETVIIYIIISIIINFCINREYLINFFSLFLFKLSRRSK